MGSNAISTIKRCPRHNFDKQLRFFLLGSLIFMRWRLGKGGNITPVSERLRNGLSAILLDFNQST